MTKALLILAVLNNDLHEKIKEYQGKKRIEIEKYVKEDMING